MSNEEALAEARLYSLDNVKTAQQYVDEDAKANGIPAIPIPTPEEATWKMTKKLL